MVLTVLMSRSAPGRRIPVISTIGSGLLAVSLIGCGGEPQTVATAASDGETAVSTANLAPYAKGNAGRRGRPKIPTGGRLEREKMRARGEAPK